MTLTCEHCGSNYPHPHHPGCVEGETARLRALLDERTALLRECEPHIAREARCICDRNDGSVCYRHETGEGQAKDATKDLSRRIAATLKETT